MKVRKKTRKQAKKKLKLTVAETQKRLGFDFMPVGVHILA